jgi:putative ABC transport system permease protein
MTPELIDNDPENPIDENTIYDKIAKLDGVALTTKVFQKQNVETKIGMQQLKGVNLYGIVPGEFGKVAWFKPELLPYNWYQYLNLMTKEPSIILVSKNLQDTYGLEIGERIYYKWDDNLYLEGVIGAFVDYWPTYTSKGDGNHDMIIVNQNYIDRKISIKPYEIWIKKVPGAAGGQIYKGFTDNKIQYTKFADANQLIIKQKNDPMLQGTNGALSLGFIATMSITLLGFLIYWVMSIKDRTLQFGILRAMGLGFGKINKILASEQLLVSGVAVLMGIIIGEINSRISMPLLNITASQSKQVLPQMVVSYAGDYLKLGSIFVALIVGGFLILRGYVSRIKIDQAIKLGED